jgi:hypothetical protein
VDKFGILMQFAFSENLTKPILAISFCGQSGFLRQFAFCENLTNPTPNSSIFVDKSGFSAAIRILGKILGSSLVHFKTHCGHFACGHFVCGHFCHEFYPLLFEVGEQADVMRISAGSALGGALQRSLSVLGQPK